MSYFIEKMDDHPGIPIVIGILPDVGVQIRVTDQWGNVAVVRSGDKSHIAPGAFEVYTPYPNDYTFDIAGQIFSIRGMVGRTQYVTFGKGEHTPPLEPEPEPEMEEKYIQFWDNTPDWKGSLGWPLREEYKPWTTFDLPESFQGRPLTRRGVHWLPDPYHEFWLERGNWWMDEAVDMGLTWITMLTSGDSAFRTTDGNNPALRMLERGLIPIIRDKMPIQQKLTSFGLIEQQAKMYQRFGVPLLWQPYNEYKDHREWKNKARPPEDIARKIFIENLLDAIPVIIKSGGYVLIPDAPNYGDPQNGGWDIMLALEPIWHYIEQGKVGFAFHNYGLGRSVFFPYDGATQVAKLITEHDRGVALDDFYTNRSWYDLSTERINKERKEKIAFSSTAMGQYCFMGWETIAKYSKMYLGFTLPMFMTEGGWTPRDRAGSTPETFDLRWDLTTPRMVGKKTLTMFRAKTPIIGMCPWIIADDEMAPGGFKGWPFESWYGWAYREMYGKAKPVVRILKGSKPKPIPFKDFVVLPK